MSEMVMVLPLLLVVLSLLIFLGRGTIRVQRAQVMDRYEAWRAVARASGPDAGGAWSAWGPHADASRGHILLNQTFLGGNASRIEGGLGDLFPNYAWRALESAGSNRLNDTGRLMDQVIQRADHGQTAHFNIWHAADVLLWQQLALDRPSGHEHTRLGTDWTYADSWTLRQDWRWEPAGSGLRVEPALAALFFNDLDQTLAGAGTRTDSPLPQRLRDLYRAQPPYVGPTVIR